MSSLFVPYALMPGGQLLLCRKESNQENRQADGFVLPANLPKNQGAAELVQSTQTVLALFPDFSKSCQAKPKPAPNQSI